MKMIDVYMKMTNFEIELGTKLIIGDYTFVYVKRWLSEKSVSYRFEDMKEKMLEDYYDIDLDFLNKEVELIPPKPKKYLIKLNVKWLKSSFSHVNYVNRGTDQYVLIGDDENLVRSDFSCYQTQFTEKELQSIKPVKEFLDDMQGKYELVEVDE